MAGTLRDVIEPGDYTIEVTGSKAGALLGEAKARFTVFEQDLEMENAAARPELMASLAKMTAASGGKVGFPGATARTASGNQKSAARPRGRNRNQIHPLGHFAVLLAGGRFTDQ